MSPSSSPLQEGAEPHLWALQGEASQEIQWPRRGDCILEGEPGQGRREEKRGRAATEASTKQKLQKMGGFSAAGPLKKLVATASGGVQPHPPPCLPSPGLPKCPCAVLLPGA